MARLVLPPSGITALVEFLEPSQAKKAFQKLAYSKVSVGVFSKPRPIVFQNSLWIGAGKGMEHNILKTSRKGLLRLKK